MLRPLRLALILLLILAPDGGGAAETRSPDIDHALRRAAGFLIDAQDADGAWRSGVHGSFRDGASLTPHVLSTLWFLHPDDPAALESFRRGRQYLTTLALRSDSPALHYPVYTSAAASWVAVLESRTRHALRVQAVWLGQLRQRQLNASQGWADDDPHFGGWGYSPNIPHKPPDGEARHPLLSSNLSATVYALGALRSAHAPVDDPAIRDALVFVQRCQNFADDPAGRDEQFDDGGFFFQPGDAATNKAGVAGVDRFGRTRYHSYGSMTCDGLRALLACGLPHDHPRIVAAWRWIERNLTVTTNAGRFEPARESIRDATFYYYVWSLAHASRRLGLDTIDTPQGKRHWAELLADELIRRQRDDGSWKNSLTDGREDDPLVATPFAAAALAICREALSAGE